MVEKVLLIRNDLAGVATCCFEDWCKIAAADSVIMVSLGITDAYIMTEFQ